MQGGAGRVETLSFQLVRGTVRMKLVEPNYLLYAFSEPLTLEPLKKPVQAVLRGRG